jgi:rare lipoprotein A (peptidoglycan hydrolase)
LAKAAIRARQGAGLAACAALVLLAGCASGPRGGSGIGRDGADANPPPGLAQVPDAQPRVEALRGSGGTSKPYVVLGRSYVPITDDRPWRESGLASWYGRKFHAQSTASGEPYDMYAMTAAHKTLPIPAYARVTNLSNGRSVVVRINDRGPFVDNRIIDLSYTAAHKLGMTQAGTAFVEVQVITPGSTAEAARGIAPPALPDPLTPPRHYLQAGAFGVAANATQMVERLRKAGVSNVLLREPDTATSLYRVRVGPIPNVAAFDSLAAQLARLGVDSRLITE